MRFWGRRDIQWCEGFMRVDFVDFMVWACISNSIAMQESRRVCMQGCHYARVPLFRGVFLGTSKYSPVRLNGDG